MAKNNGLLFFVLVGLQIITLLPLKTKKIKWQFFIPFITLPLYVWYESYFLRPEVLETIPIRIDLLILHPAILAGFIATTIRWIILIKNRSKKDNLSTLAGFAVAILFILACFAGFIYYILVWCGFYQ